MRKTGSVRYLAYGSNLHPLRLGERTPSARLLGTADLSGWRLSFSKLGQDGSGKCTIMAGADSVHCAIYELSRHDKTTLDAIEGVGKGYIQHDLHVPDFGHCSTYIAEPGYVDDSLLPFCWYRNLVLAGTLVHGFDEHYVTRIRRLQIRTDTNATRREQNERRVERLYRHRAD